MKKRNLLIVILILLLILMMCSCQGEGDSDVSSSGENTSESLAKESNPLVGVWNWYMEAGYGNLLVFNEDYSVYGIEEGDSNEVSIYRNKVEFFLQGTYEIVADNALTIKGYDRRGNYMELNSKFLLGKGKLILENAFDDEEVVLELLFPGTNSNKSIVGKWKTYDNDSFPFWMGTTGATIYNIEFFNDGSYATDSPNFYGRYAIVQDGNALQLFSSEGRTEELFKIKLLGCGLMVFDGPKGAYLLMRDMG